MGGMGCKRCYNAICDCSNMVSPQWERKLGNLGMFLYLNDIKNNTWVAAITITPRTSKATTGYYFSVFIDGEYVDFEDEFTTIEAAQEACMKEVAKHYHVLTEAQMNLL